MLPLLSVQHRGDSHGVSEQLPLERAAYLLTSTDHNLSAICEACGFNNTSYFGKLFKQRYGTSPGAFPSAGTILILPTQF